MTNGGLCTTKSPQPITFLRLFKIPSTLIVQQLEQLFCYIIDIGGDFWLIMCVSVRWPRMNTRYFRTHFHAFFKVYQTPLMWPRIDTMENQFYACQRGERSSGSEKSSKVLIICSLFNLGLCLSAFFQLMWLIIWISVFTSVKRVTKLNSWKCLWILVGFKPRW